MRQLIGTFLLVGAFYLDWARSEFTSRFLESTLPLDGGLLLFCIPVLEELQKYHKVSPNNEVKEILFTKDIKTRANGFKRAQAKNTLTN